MKRYQAAYFELLLCPNSFQLQRPGVGACILRGEFLAVLLQETVNTAVVVFKKWIHLAFQRCGGPYAWWNV